MTKIEIQALRVLEDVDNHQVTLVCRNKNDARTVLRGTLDYLVNRCAEAELKIKELEKGLPLCASTITPESPLSAHALGNSTLGTSSI